MQPTRVFPQLATATYLTVFAALAQVSGEPLLLFPELGALASVLLQNRRSPWGRSPALLVLTPALTAVVGIVVSNLMPYSPQSVVLILAVSLGLLGLLRSPVVPALSAGLLPLALGIRSWHYPLAIVPGTLGLALLVLLRRRRQSEPDLGPQLPVFPPWRQWLPPLAVFVGGALLLVRWSGSNLVLYPPLVVLAFETLAHGERTPWRERPLGLLVVITTAALIGLVLVKLLGPVPWNTLAAVLLTSWLIDQMQLPCPPAYAVALLPQVIDAPSIGYPLHVLTGTVWLVVVSVGAAAWRRRTHGREARARE